MIFYIIWTKNGSNFLGSNIIGPPIVLPRVWPQNQAARDNGCVHESA
jgi:hypothetical protein